MTRTEALKHIRLLGREHFKWLANLSKAQRGDKSIKTLLDFHWQHSVPNEPFRLAFETLGAGVHSEWSADITAAYAEGIFLAQEARRCVIHPCSWCGDWEVVQALFAVGHHNNFAEQIERVCLDCLLPHVEDQHSCYLTGYSKQP